MIKKEYVYRDDIEITGFVPKDMPDFDGGFDLLIAHDFFEHTFRNDNGRLHFEIKAMGAAYWVRYEDLYIKQFSRSNPKDNFSKVMGGFVSFSLPFILRSDDVDFLRRLVPHKSKRRLKTEDDTFTEALEDFLYSCRKHIETELLDYIPEERKWLTECKDYFASTHAFNYFVEGYRYAQRRFPIRDNVFSAFCTVAEKWDRKYFDRIHPFGELTHGDEIIVRYSEKTGVSCTYKIEEQLY